MSKPPLKLAQARILVTNDDGINAPGLKVLEKIARNLSRDVWVVAPEIEQSGAGHSLTLRRPLQVRRASARRFAVDGTPTDCVLLAVHHLIEGRRPDLVLSGVNRGGNLGEDVTYSGTVAAAMEATLLGIRAVALSQMREGQTLAWHVAQQQGAEVLRRLVSVPWTEGVLINVNFPYLAKGRAAGVRVVRQGRRAANIEIAHATDPMGRKYLWIGDFTSDNPVGEGTDLWAVRQGAIAVTPLHLDLSHGAMARRLSETFGVSLAARKIRLIMALRRSGVTDTAVLAAVERIPREEFVPAAFHDQAYEDRTLPIGQGQTISQPQIVALMTQALELTPRHKVLEIGTGSGYQTAVLSRLARRVYTIERQKALLAEAEQRFAKLRIHNITSIAGDGMKGWPAQAPFDRIIVTAAAPGMPETLLAQLAVGGIMVLPLGPERADQELVRLRRLETEIETEKLCDVRFVPLLPGLPAERASR